MDLDHDDARLAVLKDTSTLFQVPHSAQIGDHIAEFDLRSYSACLILRPYNISLSLEEAVEIRKDFELQDFENPIPGEVSTSLAPVLNCRFISHAQDVWKRARAYARPYSDINLALHKGYLRTRERRIFVIH